MEITMLVSLCLGFLFFPGMAGAIAFDKPEWADPFFSLTVMSEGAAPVIAAVMVFLTL